MKALKVTKNKVVVEITLDDLYTIFQSLNAVVEEYDILDFNILERHKDVVNEALKELTNMLVKITDTKGNLVS